MSTIFVNIGDTVTLNGEEYVCHIGDCSECDIVGQCDKLACSAEERCDCENVCFRRI